MDSLKEIPEDTPERALSDLAHRMGTKAEQGDPHERSAVLIRAVGRLVEASSLRADWLRRACEWLELEANATDDPGAIAGVLLLRATEAAALVLADH